MASPFVDMDIVDIGARIVRASLRRERVFRDRFDPLAFPDDILHERYRCSAEGINATFAHLLSRASGMPRKEVVLHCGSNGVCGFATGTCRP